ncbi:hypothetical protein RB653_003179 [Dictyostelium firmibasis]|uniref:EGF-like domain-containing protein n=1 Tax=Dictyostelium firmibasis TaxID=79012 RepID=A0AAN7YTF9_9MYCE
MLKYSYLIYLLLICEISNALIKIEYDCLEKLFTNLGSISTVSKNSTTLEYNFCGTKNYVKPFISVTCNIENNWVTELGIGQTNMSFVLQDELLCFKNLTEASLSSINYNKDIFYESIPQKVLRLQINGNDIQFSKLPSNIIYFSSIVSSQKIPTSINLSWLIYLNQFSIDKSYIISKGSHLFTYNNDLDGSKTLDLSYFDIYSLNIPNLKYANVFLTLKLLIDYDQSSWSNITSWTSLRGASITSTDTTVFPPIISQIKGENITDLKFNIPFSNVQAFINFSQVGESFQTLKFMGSSRDFTMGGTLPIILPTNEAFSSFQLRDAYIETFDMSSFTNVKVLSLVNNSMSGSLPPILDVTTFKKLKSIDISNNQITGTIDNSYCEFDLIVTNNNMDGTIPSCFTCFFGLSNINLESNFANNNFENLDQPSSPSIIIPNIMIGDSTPGNYELFIFGENIGGTWIPYNAVTTSTGISLYIDVLKPNKLIKVSSFLKPTSIIYLSYNISKPDYTFALSTDNTPPQLNTVDWQSSSINLIFDGSFFTYNKSIVNITIGNNNCLVTNTTFYQINCTLPISIDSSLQDILSFITVGNLTTQFTLNPGVVNKILNCTQYNDCNGGGYCLSDIGECKCDSNHQGIDCSLQFVECLNDCNNNIGKCNNQTGICLCPTNPYGWDGIDCSIPLHTISAVSPSNTKGGNASIYGWFGNIHSNLQVLIGNKECKPIYNTTEFEIKCNAPAGTGLQSVSVIQNSINVTAKDIYQYYSTDKTCPNDCTSTSNGICNTTTGYCNCIGRWSGYDCSLYSNPSGGDNGGLPGSNSTIDNNTGGTNITNQQTNYQILITKLVEIDFSGKSIKEYILLNKWTVYSNNSKTIYTFIQSIQNDQCNITYTIEEINKDREVSFAGIIFKLTSGSVKMTVSVENYQYSSNLNTLQLQMKSSVNNIQTNDINDCNNDQIEIDNKSNQDNSLNYLAIKKDAKVLNGRFIDRIESDGKSTFMQTVLVSKSNDSITVGMNLPHCTKKCLLDPDFSVLISPEFVDECGNDKRESWFLPVVIAVPVCGVAAIAAIVYLIYKKRFIEVPLKRKLQRISTSKN